MNPLVSFLIVSFNSEKYVSDCLNSVLRQSEKDFEVIVLDNNSTDNTMRVLQEFKNPQVTIVRNTSNLGYGGALNVGIAKSRGEYIAILNADVVLDENWASILLELFSNNDEIMAASGKVLFPNGDVQSTGGIMDRYGAVIQRGSKLFKKCGMVNDAEFFYCDGSSMMARKKILNETSFDPKLFLYYEDVDLSWRIRMLRYKIGFSEKSISYHYMGHSNSDMTPDKFYYIARNRIYICLKNYSSKRVLTRIPVALFLIFLDSIYYGMSKKSGFFRVSLRAFWWNMMNLNHTRKEHKKLNSFSKVSENELDKYMINYSIEMKILKSTHMPA